MNINQGNICGKRIKALRKKNNLTQCQLAELLHMSRSTVLKYETGRQIPPVDRICDIADIFDVSTDYLYGVSDCSLPLSKLNEIFYDDMTYSELISIVLGLSEEHQKAFMIILECLRKNKIVHPSEMLHSQAHKSFTAASIALGGAASRTVTDAVRNGSQIADRFSITWFSGKQKRTRFQCFHIS